MRIAYVVPMLAPYAVPRYQALAQLPNTEVHVIIEQDKSQEREGWSFSQIEGVHMYLLEEKIFTSYVQKNKKDYYYTNHTRLISYGLKKYIHKIDPDVVLVCNSTQIMMLLGSRKYKLGIIVEDTLRAQESRGRFKRLIKKAMLKHADFYVPFTEDAVLFLKENGINNPLIKSSWSMDTEFFSDLSEKDKEHYKSTNSIDALKNYILVANLIPCKGIDQFLDGWFAMNSSFHEHSKLFILGNGGLYNHLLDRLSNETIKNVALLGNKPYIEVSHFLQCGDIFVLPTLEDLCSLAVLEAMAAHLPVLTTIYNGAKDFVEDGVNGYIFNPLDKSSVIEVLSKTDEADLDEMSYQSAKKIVNYSSVKVMKNFRRDLESILYPSK